MITVEFIKETLNKAQISGISGIIIKNDKAFITLEITKKDDTSSIENSISYALQSYIDKSNINLIFTNKDGSFQGKKKHHINGVHKLIVVASGKGGVGKSTIAASLAHQYHQAGHNVGIIDADIYGPSIPSMFNVNDRPEILNNQFIPIDASGIKIMSVGFLVDVDACVAWRGPMASKILYQMLSTTQWGKLDYLIVDMPPGTGDVHLSILENYQIDGVVIVTTPQAISMIDADRAINLYKKFDIPILAIIENMHNLFPGEAGMILAQKYGVNKLQKIEFDKQVCDNIFIDDTLILLRET